MKLETILIYIYRILDTKKILILALAIQTVYFAEIAYVTRDEWLRGDNTLYETPAQNLANGHGLSFSRNQWEDPYLTDLYHAKHPEMKTNEYVPATTLPIGYSIFLAGIYTIFGRNLFAAIIANLLLLYISITVYYFLTRRVFGKELEARIALSLMTIFPLWAFWATLAASDTLHITFLSLFALVFFRKESSLFQLVLAGLLLGLASAVRPYTILLPFAFAFAGWVFRCPAFTLRKTAIVGLSCWMILGFWVVRNYYQFDKPMLTSMSIGYGLWVASYKEVFTDDIGASKLNDEANSLELGDPSTVEGNARYKAVAIERIKQKPFKQILVTFTAAPRIWVSLGGANFPLFWKIILGIYLLSLLISIVFGIWFSRKSTNPIIVGSIVIVIYYTLMFIPFGVEGRFILPARFFSFLLAAITIALIIRRTNIFEKFTIFQPALPPETAK